MALAQRVHGLMPHSRSVVGQSADVLEPSVFSNELDPSRIQVFDVASGDDDDDGVGGVGGGAGGGSIWIHDRPGRHRSGASTPPEQRSANAELASLLRVRRLLSEGASREEAEPRARGDGDPGGDAREGSHRGGSGAPPGRVARLMSNFIQRFLSH